MEGGKLRHVLELQTFTETENKHGQKKKSWTPLAEVRGSVVPLSGKELVEARQLNSRTTHLIRIRHRTDFKANGRLLHRGRTFNVISVADTDERRRELLIHAAEKVV